MLDPAFASAHSALSAIFGGFGEPEERASHARLAYENRAHVTRARAALHRSTSTTTRRRRAARDREILEVWKQLYPRDYPRPQRARVSLNRFGQYDRAIEEALEAQRRNPEHPFPRSNLAYAYRARTASPRPAAPRRRPSRARPRRCRCGGCSTSSR
jgi:hypothetical protein